MTNIIFKMSMAPALAMSAAIVHAGMFYKPPEQEVHAPISGKNITFSSTPSTAAGSKVLYISSGSENSNYVVDQQLAGFYANFAGSQVRMDADLELILMENLTGLYSRS
ncbi:hypothetical protein [Polaromonas sp.]|uniref:hypothetical protein n=1 Tax=Polaromonas sp. TaxID=1869339 RepID=UPI0017D77DDA|nr:hypothetical protein [Polaromonas sp.]NML85238.1 hypothetical protein [Polaromonas sp.]